MKHTDKDCIFCKIIAGDIPSRTVYEDDDFKAILDVAPASRGHVIILPKNHAKDITELADEDTKGIFAVAKKIAAMQMDVLGCDGVNVLQNNGEAAGQTVFHLHMHVIPRYKNDTVNVTWKPQDGSDNDEVLELYKKYMQDGNK
ncbi:MAG: HIT family protein [Lachnospiraceae bacterium]|nr:HIT family protein [Lachnospiraceae bacterium]